MSDLLARTAKAIHTLFYADERAAGRMAALEASIETDAELAAFQELGVGLISFDPISPEAAAAVGVKIKESERREAERPKTPSERIQIEVQGGDEGDYVRRLLEYMYIRWQGTLDYERGTHRVVFFSPFDAQMRRHSTVASVLIDGEGSDVRARTYILGPYLRVEDYRTKRVSDDPWKVLHGDLNEILPPSEAHQ